MECPSCQTDVKVTEAQYGALFTCASCQAVYFINFEGQPEFDNSVASDQPVAGTTSLPSNTIETSIGTSVNGIPQELPADFSLTQLYQNEETLIQPPAPSALESAINEIQNFGNQNIDANLTFNLKVEGLDTKEVVGFFFDSINDSKFGWVAEDIMKTVSQGQCMIKNIKPVSAYILAKRLQFIDVKLDWSFENAI